MGVPVQKRRPWETFVQASRVKHNGVLRPPDSQDHECIGMAMDVFERQTRVWDVWAERTVRDAFDLRYLSDFNNSSKPEKNHSIFTNTSCDR